MKKSTAAILLVFVTSEFSAVQADSEWSGSLSVAGIGQNSNGSEESFRSQTTLDGGFTLDHLLLERRGDAGDYFKLSARGFGDADPYERLRVDWRPASAWRLRLDYDRRESFFRVREFEQDLRGDDWDIARWRARAEWRGWDAATVGLEFRHYDRSGRIDRPLFALNARYPLRVSLDETMDEGSFFVESRSWPVTVRLEQSFATYETANGWQPANSDSFDELDEDLFASAQRLVRDERDVSTTRIVASYSSERIETVGSIVWRPTDLDVAGGLASSLAIDGGDAGRIDLIDDLVASGDLDSLAANFRVGWAISEQWVLRLDGDYRDYSNNAALVGQRLLRATNPLGGSLDLPFPIASATALDVEDRSTRVTLEWARNDLTAWVGGVVGSRDVDDRRPDSLRQVDRDSDGLLVGGSWKGERWSGQAEYTRNSFDEFVFRTDVDTTDRFDVRIRSHFDSPISFYAKARVTESDNPQSQSNLDQSSKVFGIGLDWIDPDGTTSLGLGVDWLNVEVATDLILPNGGSSISEYDLDLLTMNVRVAKSWDRTRLSASFTRMDESGNTWPVESLVLRARVVRDLTEELEVFLRGEYWDYDESRAELDDYQVSRFGIGVTWKFQ